MADSTDVFDIMHSTRAMRRLKPDPVPDDLIRKILEAGICAANGGNAQKWKFMVLKKPEMKKAVQVWYKKAFDEVIGPRYASSAPPPGSDPARFKRQHSAVEYLTEHYHEAPVWIVCCLEDGPNPNRSAGSSIYPAVQNMLLAARALGLGSTLTTRHIMFEKEADAALGLPPGVHSYAILPIGYPMGKFGPVGRGKIEEFTYSEKWASPTRAPDMAIAFTVNGESRSVSAPETATLLDVLRNHLGLMGTRYGCGLEQCGSCTVLVDGALAYACTREVGTVAGRAITTVEGLGSAQKPHPIQQAFLDEQAGQCGYCLTGIVMSTKALLDRNPAPSRADIVVALDRHLCRCGAHQRILRAVERAAATLRGAA